MKDLEKIFKRINQLTAPTRKLSNTFNKIIPPSLLRLNNNLSPTFNKIDKINSIYKNSFIKINEITKAFEPFISELNSTMQKVARAAKRWQEARKEDVTEMAENGWYPNWFTFDYIPENEPQSLDELMLIHYKDDWDEITSKILELCPNRVHILENAFKLHTSGNYVAAIPLFLSQSDGICCESLKSFLFTGNEVEEKINNLIDSGEFETDMLTDIFLEPFKLKNHHNAGISKSSKTAKAKAPNRNGILHGHRKHLDYGSEINSLKCFSLLSFVVYSTKELMQMKKD